MPTIEIGQKLSAKRSAMRKISRKEKGLKTIISQGQIQVESGNGTNQQ